MPYNERLSLVTSVPETMILTFEYDCFGYTSRHSDWLIPSFKAERDARRGTWQPRINFYTGSVLCLPIRVSRSAGSPRQAERPHMPLAGLSPGGANVSGAAAAMPICCHRGR
jgi:hypothetical protein